MPRDPGTSNAQDIEDVFGEGDFLSPSWFMTWAAFGANMTHGAQSWLDSQPGGVKGPPSLYQSMEDAGLHRQNPLGLPDFNPYNPLNLEWPIQ